MKHSDVKTVADCISVHTVFAIALVVRFSICFDLTYQCTICIIGSLTITLFCWVNRPEFR